MHYQLTPSSEVKVVRCVRGAFYDVIADLRPDSPTYGKTFGVELTADNRTQYYVPRGFAHGLITLTDDTEVMYQVSAFYAPELERGMRHDDPWLNIEWPIKPVEISEKDRNWPLFDARYHGVEQLRGMAS
jgi:dTDP-4-dehydrorhamnose 3,5-epimerase